MYLSALYLYLCAVHGAGGRAQVVQCPPLRGSAAALGRGTVRGRWTVTSRPGGALSEHGSRWTDFAPAVVLGDGTMDIWALVPDGVWVGGGRGSRPWDTGGGGVVPRDGKLDGHDYRW